MPSSAAQTVSGSTRDRLLAAGLGLFAQHGFSAVSVGQIERAAGLVPRRGALYRHFGSKDELLEAAVRRHLESVTAGRERFAHPMRDDVRGNALALARWVLRELDNQRDITGVLERDGDRLPQLRDSFRREVSDASYAGMAEVLRGWLVACTGDGSGAADVDALAVHLLSALVNVRRSTWTLGEPPFGMDDERTATSWADLCDSVVRAMS
jgi:AcrR family transcriptional regulator